MDDKIMTESIARSFSYSETLSLEFLLNIWPVTSSIASHATAGDLVSLSRASSATRAAVHGSNFERKPHGIGSDPHSTFRGLCIGQHQTPQWTTLKSTTAFVCSVATHKEPRSSTTNANVVRPCKFCSRPICSTCKVRSWFADQGQSQKSLKHRTRYLCTKCWQTGNLRKDFRYPAEHVSREHIFQGRSYDQRGGRCTCSASDDNWVCTDCRTFEIASGPSNKTLDDVRRDHIEIGPKTLREVDAGQANTVTCYGLNCNNLIDDYNRDGRRICLWCSKGLPRQFAGESRLRWQQGQVEIRAINAESRSRDMLEYHRNRFRALTMSRREMRSTEQCVQLTGKDGLEHDEAIYVRHLDAVNYRALAGDAAAPTPDEVYQSKNGRWRYSAEFLKAAGRQVLLRARLTPIESRLYLTTREGSSIEARQNKAFSALFSVDRRRKSAPEVALFNMSVHCFEAGIMTRDELENVTTRKYRWPKQYLLKQLLTDLEASLAICEDSASAGLASREPASFADLLIVSRATVKGGNGVLRSLEPPPACNDDAWHSQMSHVLSNLQLDVHDDVANLSHELAFSDSDTLSSVYDQDSPCSFENDTKPQTIQDPQDDRGFG